MAMKPRMLVVVRMLSMLPMLKKLRPLTAVRTAPATMATSRTPYTIVVDVTVLRRFFTARPLARAALDRTRVGHGSDDSPGTTPVAVDRTCSSVAPRGSSPAIRPSFMTRIRSDMPITSGSSLETMSTATPSAARLRITS